MSFFKAYDMRGTFGVDFDLDMVYRVGRALPQVVKGNRWLVGRDCRLTSPEIRDALVAGLTEAGVEVTDLGICTTSMVYFFTGEDGFDGSVMITASHNPPSDNGLKVSCFGARPVSYASGLAEVEKIVEGLGEGVRQETRDANEVGRETRDENARCETRDAGKETRDARQEFHARYLDYMKAKLPAGLDTLKFAADCSNGMSSLFVHELFPKAVIINDDRDGNFPAHSPNPLKPESRVQLGQVVREQGLDCGVIFDGDADRAMFVDENGEFVQPDYLIPIVAKATVGEDARQETGDVEGRRSVLHDIRTSRGAIEALREAGFEPVMVPVGPALAKPMMRELDAPVGGELAGHYYFKEFHFCDSGILAALRVLGEIAAAKKAGKSFSEMMRPITSRYANSGELNYKTEDKDGAIRRVLAAASAFGAVTARSDIDGIRLEFADGWFNVRKSNTEPYLRLLVEHRSKETLAARIKILEAAIAG